MPVKFKDYYETLGVSRTATQDEIQKAYRKLARKYHPDVNKEKGAEARFKEANEANEVLGDPEKRKKYDTLGEDWKSGQEFRPPPEWGNRGADFRGRPTGPAGGQTFEFGQGDFSDFFEMFFGRGGGATAGRRPGGRRGGGAVDIEELLRGAGQGGPRGPGGPGGGGGAGGFGNAGGAGQTHEAELTVSLEDAFKGATRQITLRGANGDGERTYQVRIPAGTTEGSTIRLAGQGGQGAGGAAGDLLLRIHLAPDPRFEVSGHDLTTTLPITPWEAALGDKVSVPTMDGPVTMTIPAGSQSGQRLRLRGKGLPKRDGGHGDLFAVLKTLVPKSLTEAERRLFEELKKESKFEPRKE